jgi:soluble lytic murein transglycosylase-like protein
MKIMIFILLFMVSYTYANDSIENKMLAYKESKSHHYSHRKIHPNKVPSPNNTVQISSYEGCFNTASVHYSVPSYLLKAIAKVESKMNPLAIGINRNGTYDIGIMQVNSSWFPRLAKVGIQRGELLDGCENIQVGAWILAQNIKRYGLTAEAIGRYNSSNAYYKNVYAYKVLDKYEEMKNLYYGN